MSLGTLLTAIVTPFTENLEIDEACFVDLMHHLAAQGSDGFVVCGTTGEASTLTDDEHLRMIELACKNRPSGVRIVAGAGSNHTRHAVHLTERATELGADAILSVTPYYNKPNRCGIVEHYRQVAKATDKPIILYNIPSRTGLDLPNDFLASLAQIEHVDYIKQANNASLAHVDGLGLYAGNDEMFARVLDMGGCGVISVASHVVGGRMRQMIQNPEQRARLNAELLPIYEALFVTTNPIPVKAALNMIGRPVGGLRLPLIEASAAVSHDIRAALERVGLLHRTPISSNAELHQGYA